MLRYEIHEFVSITSVPYTYVDDWGGLEMVDLLGYGGF